MCGILIAIDMAETIDLIRFDKARDTLAHRGPDAAGTTLLARGNAALGHRRLAIIDLSANANQPMKLDELQVTFNGEIYNYPKLREELEREGCIFRTRSDTEVLLHGYRVWGEAMCRRLEGMFAFAIWDDASRTLFAARDHVGQKPFYYHLTGTRFVAASEIKALASYLGGPFRLRDESLMDNLYFDCVPEPYTWYRDVLSLPPGHSLKMTCQAGKLDCSVRQYWNFTPPLEPLAIDHQEAIEHLGRLLEETVADHMLADVEVGAFLSGGVDSAGITLLASRLSASPVRAFSIGFSDSDDELERASQSARTFGAVHVTELVHEVAFQQSVDRVLQLFDQPFSDTSLVPTDRVSALAAKQVKVVLTGDGGDEVLGGYWYGRHLSPWLDTQRRPGGSAKRLALMGMLWAKRLAYSTFGEKWWLANEDPLKQDIFLWRLRSFFGTDVKARVRTYDPGWAIEKYRVEGLDPFRLAQWSGLKLALPSKMLVKVDRCTMAHSLEARAPLLAPRFIEFVLSLPTAVKNPRSDWFKGLYRSYLKGQVPDSVIKAPKRGFSTPSRWRPVAQAAMHKIALDLCIEAHLLRRESLERVTRHPKLLWQFLQIEQALAGGLMVA
jgi:asparagine synthase (glutamine-hydrolysing)